MLIFSLSLRAFRHSSGLAVTWMLLLTAVLSACGGDVLTLSARDYAGGPKQNVTLVDVRSNEEWQAGHVTGAVHIPVGEVADVAGAKLPDKAAPIVVYCKSGGRAERAASGLVAMGYTNVRAITRSGFADLQTLGLPTER